MRLRRSRKPTDAPLNPRFSKSLFGGDGAVRVMAAPQPGVREVWRDFAILLRKSMGAYASSIAFDWRIKLVFASRMGPLCWTKIGKVCMQRRN